MSKAIRLHEEIERLKAELAESKSRADALDRMVEQLREVQQHITAEHEKILEGLTQNHAGLQAINEDLRAQLREQVKANASLGDRFRQLWLALKKEKNLK